ncbi:MULTISPECIES: NUDIX domain-containing protein [unclassified Rhizobium]|uniref:NUDIX domain-containing protein n=1 Tax=unclassified Rhizobium TaxID=2613769 RepID=UPI001AD9EF0A|nr:MULTISPECIES: NUDIX domain-containing protein [unclassified Rhizobium]MBO9098532.1 NUDIX domain-containing protein [Rhizobium sp. L58/93]MBO9132662.1 NUDIX domain-containing protein [Rhizobium sp. B209b/85]MBO9168798.1 NUDIX domain-containing protein [Rhizobium sp. L245/93]MBO9184748.1 NUDIX domain-containing protein [Rhizobium sp. E27B/91]QXZ84927.1 NUDIX domain-containing protein [Rhizobium sp. K1/93]
MTAPGTDFPGLGTGLAILRDGKLLLYKRIKAPEAGFWNIVGGKVDLMEASASAARREAGEESGLQIGQIDLLCTTEQIIEADRQHWVSLIYVCTDFVGEPSLMEPDKLFEFGWFSRNALPSPLSVFTRAAIDHLDTDLFP